MKFYHLLNEIKDDMSNVSPLEIQYLNKNLELFIKNYYDMDSEQREKMLEGIIDMMMSISKKIPGRDKYERFIAKLTASEDKIDIIVKIIQYNNRVLKEKQANANI